MGSLVYWKQKNGTESFAGKIIGFTEEYGSEFIKVQVTKPIAKAKKGLLQLVSKGHFDGYFFTEERPLGVAKNFVLKEAELMLSQMVGKINPKWIWSDGSEALLVTSMKNFIDTTESIFISIDGLPKIRLADLLCLGKGNENSHAKLRLTHPRNECVGGEFPIIILDGPDAFDIRSHLSGSANVLVILDRMEYQERIHNAVLQLQNTAQELEQIFSGLPDHFPFGVECAAYSVKAN